MFKSNDFLRKQTSLKVPLDTPIYLHSLLGVICWTRNLKPAFWSVLSLNLALAIKCFLSLQGERKVSVLIGIVIFFALHVVGVYWWYWSDDLLFPLLMIPPKAIPPFWHAIFIIMVNGVCPCDLVIVIFLLLHRVICLQFQLIYPIRFIPQILWSVRLVWSSSAFYCCITRTAEAETTVDRYVSVLWIIMPKILVNYDV